MRCIETDVENVCLYALHSLPEHLDDDSAMCFRVADDVASQLVCAVLKSLYKLLKCVFVSYCRHIFHPEQKKRDGLFSFQVKQEFANRVNIAFSAVVVVIVPIVALHFDLAFLT